MLKGATIKGKFLNSRIVRLLTYWAKKFTIVGFDKVPVYIVIKFFIHALVKGSLANRAASVSFSFFIAIFPGIIFLFTLIPIIPIDGFQETLLNQITGVLPLGVKQITYDTIVDLINTPREGLLSFNFVLAMFFATNGVFSLIDEFNNTSLFNEKRNYFVQRLVALFLIIILTVLVITAIALVMFSGYVVDYALQHQIVSAGIGVFMLNVVKWLTVFLLYYFAISFLYYFGPAKRKTWQFFSAGSTLATILVILTSVAFSYYVSNLNQYNKIYGSIGTILIVLLWININSYLLLIGFELNASIKKARLEGGNLVQ